jgi:hypothetical protein
VACTAQTPPVAALKFWYNGASTTDVLDRHENLMVVDDLPEKFPGGPQAYARRYAHVICATTSSPSVADDNKFRINYFDTQVFVG